MAPPTGPRNGSSTTTTRTTRSSIGGSAPSRGGSMRGGSTRGGSTRGGGIRKRGGPGAVRIDRDGDMMMDGQAPRPSSGPRGSTRTRGSSRGGRQQRTAAITAHKLERQIGAGGDTDLAARITQGTRRIGGRNKKIVKIVGLGASKAATNEDRGLKTALEFLERKSLNTGKGFTAIKSYIDADHNLFLMVNEDDIPEVVKLDSFSFAGSILSITESSEPWPEKSAPKESKLSDQAGQRKAQLQQVLQVRYNADVKLLDLSKLGEDPTLIGMGYLESKELAEKTFKVLMTLCDEAFDTAEKKRDMVESISLAGNSIDRVTQVFDVATTFPKLLHLDLSNNHFKTLRNLNPWRGKFRQLETLVLTGNPLETEEPNYKTDIMKWYPYLVQLNQDVVRQPEEVAAEKAAAAAGPQPIPQFGSDFRDISAVGENFVRQFFPLYDNDKDQLVSRFYDDSTTFSLSVSTHTPRKESSTAVAPWAAYLQFSRNLNQITGLGGRIKRLFNGGQMIKECWNKLPATRHPDLTTEVHKYIIDCHKMPGLADPTKQNKAGVDGLIINIHGEFEESGPDGKISKRSFSRTFVLGPGASGQQPIRVISDMLSLRAHADLPQPSATPTPAAPVAPVAPAAPQAPAPQVTEPAQDVQQQMIEALCKQTGLNPEYSKMCLAQVGWNFDLALVTFNGSKANLTADMFMPGMMPTA